MQRIISDLLVIDVLGPISAPSYHIDEEDSECTTSPILMFKQSHVSYIPPSENKTHIITDMFELSEPWSNFSYRTLPTELEQWLNLFWLSVEKEVDLRQLRIKTSTFAKAFELSNTLINGRLLGNILSHPDLLEKNKKFLYDKNWDRCTVGLKGLPPNVILFLPEPEMLGCSPVSADGKQFGAWLFPDHVLRIEIEQ